MGTAILLTAEKWPPATPFGERVMVSAFQAVSASTTDGFNTIDIAGMSATSLTFIVILMFVGASPGGTRGGVKTSTLGLILTFIWLQLRHREANANMFKREIPVSTVHKAFGVVLWFALIAAAGVLILSATEKVSYLQVLFETISALGNTGLSTGITPNLSNIGKITLTIIMFLGRIGPVAAGFSLVGERKPVLYEYATEDIFVG